MRRGGLALEPGVTIVAQTCMLVGRQQAPYRFQGEDFIGRLIPVNLRKGLVHKKRLPVAVDQNPGNRALDKITKVLLALTQCQFGRLASGHVLINAEEIFNLAARSAYASHRKAYINGRSVFANEPLVDGIAFKFSFLCLIEQVPYWQPDHRDGSDRPKSVQATHRVSSPIVGKARR